MSKTFLKYIILLLFLSFSLAYVFRESIIIQSINTFTDIKVTELNIAKLSQKTIKLKKLGLLYDEHTLVAENILIGMKSEKCFIFNCPYPQTLSIKSLSIHKK